MWCINFSPDPFNGLLVYLKDSDTAAPSVDSDITYAVIYLSACSRTYIEKHISEVIFCGMESILNTEKIAPHRRKILPFARISHPALSNL